MFCPPIVTASDAGRRRAPPHALARHLAHVALDLLAGAVALRLGVAAFEPRHHTFELRGVRALAAVPVAVRHLHRGLAGAVEDDLLVLLLQLLPRRVGGEAELRRDRLEHALEVVAAEARPRRDGTVAQAEVVVGDEQLGVDLEAGAQAVAPLARAVRRVEREVARRELVERDAAVRAREVLREHQRLEIGRIVVPRHDLDLGDAFGQAQRGLQRVGEPPLDARTAHQPVDDHLDGVVLVAGQSLAGGRAQLDQLAVDPGPREALGGELLEQAVVLALAAAHDGREHLEAGALLELQHAVDDLLRASGG